MIYLDNAATTIPFESVIETLEKAQTEFFYNPSSQYKDAVFAKVKLDEARATVAQKLNANKENVFFTSSATLANAIALNQGKHMKNCNHIITTMVEHDSVYENVKEMESENFDCTFISPEKNGEIDIDKLLNNVKETTSLVSIQHVNNEMGAIQKIENLKEKLSKINKNTLLHIDMVQSFLKLPTNVKALNVDFASVSSHKVHGVKGVAALYIKNTSNFHPLYKGGGQEKGIASGTENLPSILAFKKAIEEYENVDLRSINQLNEYARKRLLEIKDISLISNDNAIFSILSFATNKIRSEVMLNFLSDKKIYLSAGSACSRGKESRVLKSMNLDKKTRLSSLRASFSYMNTQKDIDDLCVALKIGIDTLFSDL